MKKVLAMILAVLMLACLFAACDTTETPVTDPTDPVSEPTEPTEPTLEDVTLTLWCSETETWQSAMKELTDAFIAEKAGEANITIEIGAQSESTAKDTVLNDVEAAADVFFFADDQLSALVAGNALQPVEAVDEITAANGEGSVAAASINGTLYAYPATASNGYFLYYNKNVLSEEDIASMDALLAKCEAEGKYFSFDGMGAWVSPYTFFAGAGMTAKLADDGVTTYCDWNNEGGAAVVQAMLDLFANPAIHAEGSDEGIAACTAGDAIAIINGTWNAGTMQTAFGDGYACAKLPTYTLDGKQVQMGSFAGYKFAGVSAYSDNVYWAMELAKYLTNQAAQEKIFAVCEEGPANKAAGSSEAVLANPAIAALSAQSAFATTQTVSANYWTAAGALHQLCVDQNPDGKTTQEIVDAAVEGITAPIA